MNKEEVLRKFSSEEMAEVLNNIIATLKLDVITWDQRGKYSGYREGRTDEAQRILEIFQYYGIN